MSSHKEYKKRLYKRLSINLLKNRNVLDVGCGDGEDAYNISKIAKNVVAFDIEVFPKWKKYKKSNLKFHVAFAEKIPFKNSEFDGVFLKDVIHHVKNQERALKEISRVTKKGAVIILVEGNRYNPFFYIHMTKMLGHEHLTKAEFKRKIDKVFSSAEVSYYHFESHFFPTRNKMVINMVKLLEFFMEKTPVLNQFLSYNVAIIKK